MNLNLSYPVTADNGTRYVVSLNYEPKRQKLNFQIPWFAILFSLGTLLHLVMS